MKTIVCRMSAKKKAKRCDVCQKRTESVSQYPDGIYRCWSCVEIQAYGRTYSWREVARMSSSQIANLNEDFETWIDTLKKETEDVS